MSRGPKGKYEPEASITVKFIDGPLTGQKLHVTPREDHVSIGGILYSYCGKENRVPLYARVPKQHRVRKLLLAVIGRRGKDPRRLMAEHRREPVKRTAPPAAGRGRRRREARRAQSA